MSKAMGAGEIRGEIWFWRLIGWLLCYTPTTFLCHTLLQSHHKVTILIYSQRQRQRQRKMKIQIQRRIILLHLHQQFCNGPESHNSDFLSTNHCWGKQRDQTLTFLTHFSTFTLWFESLCAQTSWNDKVAQFCNPPRFGSQVIHRLDRCREDTIHPDMITILMRNDGSASGFGRGKKSRKKLVRCTNFAPPPPLLYSRNLVIF